MRTQWPLALLVGASIVAAMPYDRAALHGMHRAERDSTVVVPLDRVTGLTPIGVRVHTAMYQGRRGVQLVEAPVSRDTDGFGEVALIDGVDFGSGAIELLVAGRLAPGADTSARGFVGVVFRSTTSASRFENVFLRPTNGRADDQLRRNHAVQYQSAPDYPWHRLRRESPGRYEAYVDLEPGVWTKMRVVVAGARAQLFVNGASQPCLIVNDLRLGDTHGRIGLWIGPGTEAYFAHLVISPATTH